MKIRLILALVLALVVGFGAAVVADWDPGENVIFFQRLGNMAFGFVDIYEEGGRLISLAASHDIVNSPNFVDVGEVTTAEAVAMKSVIDDFDVFLNGGSVLPDENRRAKVDAFLANFEPR